MLLANSAGASRTRDAPSLEVASCPSSGPAASDRNSPTGSGPERHRFGTGDLLFMATGVEHRFEEFTGDLAVWVIFYGPDDGEQEGRE
jgi:hypothetical protein